MRYEKSFYQVFECADVNDCWSIPEQAKTLCETENLAEAHSYAWNLWLADKSKAYTIIQPYDGSCRGGYGKWTEQEE